MILASLARKRNSRRKVHVADMFASWRRLFPIACFLMVFLSANAKQPVSYRVAPALSPTERRILDKKARQGDEKAAFRLALYYSSVVKNLRRREYYLLLSTKSGSFESIEALADFYAMPGGIFDLDKAVSLRKRLQDKFPDRADNSKWAEECAYDYRWRGRFIDPKKERTFLKLAASWRRSEQTKRKE
jgi:hypothetical protein